ncbi:tyrosine-type recombinase/integrase [Geodermatophilus sp. CPCC 205506]|uniref:tyrosine-type recombinase/integrase n=1 Tax=Geodermatophilus sp. CPCC 205506 TaxID=2936596 RepID=UPI003EEDB5B2
MSTGPRCPERNCRRTRGRSPIVDALAHWRTGVVGVWPALHVGEPGRQLEGTRHGRPGTVLRRFEVLAERAGLRGVTLHTLRHSAASFLLAACTHTKVVQEHLGHSSYAVTADIYSHVGPAQQREATDRLDEALRW